MGTNLVSDFPKGPTVTNTNSTIEGIWFNSNNTMPAGQSGIAGKADLLTGVGLTSPNGIFIMSKTISTVL